MVYPRGLPYNEGVKKGRTLYIKNPVAHRLAEQLSRHRGGTLTDAVIHALEDQIRKKSRPLDCKRVDQVCASIHALPVLDSRTPDEILGYDDSGVPR